MSETAIASRSWVPAPLYACLKKADERLGAGRVWRGSGPGHHFYMNVHLFKSLERRRWIVGTLFGVVQRVETHFHTHLRSRRISRLMYVQPVVANCFNFFAASTSGTTFFRYINKSSLRLVPEMNIVLISASKSAPPLNLSTNLTLL